MNPSHSGHQIVRRPGYVDFRDYIYVPCELKMLRKGFHKDTFDSAGMIVGNTGGFERWRAAGGG